MRTYCSRLIGVPGAVTAALLLSSCNSSGLGGLTGSTTSNESATGLWSGTDSATSLGVSALIDSAGQAIFFRTDGVQFVGPAQVSGSTLAVTVNGYSNFPAAFSDGSTYGLGTVNGTVTTGSTISATLALTTNGGTALSGTWTLTFSSLSNNSSSTGAVSGNYTDSTTGAVVSINSNGVMTSQNPATGCVLNGSISTSDSSHNIYQVAYSYGNCTGTYVALNGVQFTGLATLNPSVSPVQLIMAVSGASSTNKYGIVSTLNGS